MNRNNQQLAFPQQPYVRAVALATTRESHRILLTVAHALATAIVVLWIAYLPLVTSTIMTQLNVVPRHLTSHQAIDRFHKSDRIANMKFDDRWSAIANNRASRATQRLERIPYGCDAAFSRLVKTGNFSVRCTA